MCEKNNNSWIDVLADRRNFLKVTGALTTLVAAGSDRFLTRAYADAPARDALNSPTLTKAQRDKMNPDEILTEMKRGNERFRTGHRRARNFVKQQKASAKGQFPAAAVLGCIDSRVPAEVIMDFGLGDIFNARVAGNVADADILGSLEFSCKLAGAKVILVMGHTNCGAIKGAIDNVELGNLTTLLAEMRPAIDATSYGGDRSSNNYDFVNAVSRKNVELTMTTIRTKSSVLQELESKGVIKIAGSIYNLETGQLEFIN